jgi:hypothetical protein
LPRNGGFNAGAVLVPILVAGALDLSTEELVHLINADLFTCGIASIIQSVGFWKVGVRLPLLQGVTFTAVSPMIAIGLAAGGGTAGLLQIYGAVIVAGLGPDTAVLAGGTWLYSDPQVHLRELVDLTGLGWPALTATDDGLEIAATCTLAELVAYGIPLFRQCAQALVGSFKIWNVATVGGNICLALPAGPMTSLCAALDGVAVVRPPDGGERRVPVAEFVVGDRRTVLAPGEVLRAVHLPAAALRARRRAVTGLLAQEIREELG